MIGKTVVGFGLFGAVVNVVAYHLAPKVSAESQTFGWYLIFGIVGLLGGWATLLLWSLTDQKNPLGLAAKPRPGEVPWEWWQRWFYIALLALMGTLFEVMLPYMLSQYGGAKTLTPGVWLTMAAVPFAILLIAAQIIGALGLVFEVFPVRDEEE